MVGMNNRTDSIKIPGLVETGLLYSAGAILLITLGSYVQRKNFNTGILITEFALILAPSLLLLIAGKYNVRHILRLNPVSFMNLFIILSIMAFSLWLVAVINMFNLWLIKSVFGRVMVTELPISQSPLLVNILLIGGTAGLCEEIMFRGVIQRSFEKFGAYFSIIVTALLFGLFHMDFQKLLGTFLLGILIGFIVYRTDSIFAGMFAHFCNNTFGVLINFIYGKILPSDMQAMRADMNYLNEYFYMLEGMPVFQKLFTVGAWALSALFCAVVVAALILAFVLNTSKTVKPVLKSGFAGLFPGIAAFIPGLAVITAVYVLLAFRMKGIPLDLFFGLGR